MNVSVSILRNSVFLAGPTAVGKTAVSLLLAKQLNAEIISLDSMAIYRGMDIGTAKPEPAEQQEIRHHLIDVASPSQEFSVAEFIDMAATAAQRIADEGRTPLFVGGTGLYLRSVLRGIFEGPEADWQLREQLQQSAERQGCASLHAQLAEIDPVSAQRIHINDVRRIIRAIEVFRLTGIPLSMQQTQQPRPESERPRAVFWIDPPREWLHARIHLRIDQMLQAGWLNEARWLMELVPPASRTALMALGYRELIDYLQQRCSWEQAVVQIRNGTRQFAKRQHTWFRNLEECRSMKITGDESAEELCHAILQSIAAGPEW